MGGGAVPIMTSTATCAVAQRGQVVLTLNARRANITNDVARDLMLKLQALLPLVIGRIPPKGFWACVRIE